MSVRQEMVYGVFWSAVQKYSGIVIQIIVSAILARLISPEDFGVVAVATVLISFLSMFTDMGFGAAIVQKQDLTSHDVDSIFSFSLYSGLGLASLFFFASWPIAHFYNNQELIPICQLLSANLFFASLNIVPNALFCKNKRFKFIAKRTLFFQLGSGIISVVAAFKGLGLYALLISPIVSSVGVFFVNIRQYPMRFTPIVDMAPIKGVFSYSVYLLLFNVFNYFSRNLDKLIIGRSFSMQELGYYEKSYRLMMLPLQNITHVITPVMHPILANLQNDFRDLTVKYGKIVKLLCTISFPLAAYLYFAADNLIWIVYGDRWGNAVPVFEILALSLPLQMVLSTSGAVYQISGRTDWQFYNGLFNTCITVLGFIIAAHHFNTIESMAWAWDITLTINFLTSYALMYKVVLKSSLLFFLKEFKLPFLCFIVLFVCLYGIDGLIAGHVMAFCVQTLVALVVSLVIIHTMKLYDIIDLTQQILCKIKKK